MFLGLSWNSSSIAPSGNFLVEISTVLRSPAQFLTSCLVCVAKSKAHGYHKGLLLQQQGFSPNLNPSWSRHKEGRRIPRRKWVASRVLNTFTYGNFSNKMLSPMLSVRLLEPSWASFTTHNLYSWHLLLHNLQIFQISFYYPTSKLLETWVIWLTK